MAITREDVLKIAELAKLRFSEEDLAEFTGQFHRILDYIEKLREVDVAGVSPTDHVFAAEDAGRRAWREDEVLSSLPPEAALGNAPDSGRGHFRVPRVIAAQPSAEESPPCRRREGTEASSLPAGTAGNRT